MTRKLASIQVIDATRSIEGADRIEQVDIMGWSVVVKKGEFKVGDKCVFFEIDSVLPSDVQWSQFMKPHNFRVKTVRLKGAISQGLVIPLNTIFPVNNFVIGDDVTERLQVTKYVIPEKNCIDFAGPFVSHVPKTDEIRIQSMMPMLEALKGKPYYITEKVDGTSCTIAKTNEKLYVCSRNNEIKEGQNWYWSAMKRFDLLNHILTDSAIQGEVCGPGIQKNRLNLTDIEIRVFDIYDIRGGEYWNWYSVKNFCEQHKIPTVRELERGVSFKYCLEDLLKIANGKYHGTNNRIEGIVVRPLTTERMTSGDRLSFKVLNNEYLILDED